MRRAVLLMVAILLCSCRAGLAQNQNDGKILVKSLVISGTQGVDSTELLEITNSLAGSVFPDDPDELQERLRAQFQDHGYFTAEVKNLDVKVLDPMVSPKPVSLEAKVSEGPRCHLSSIEFIGNHAVSSKELRAKFPIKAGDV
jgi:hypothetical protein